MSEEKNYIDDLITRAEYRYNGDERDMTKGNTYVVIRQTEDYIEVLDDHKEVHQFSRHSYPDFELVSVPVNEALNSAIFNDPNLNEILKQTANNYVSNHVDPEVRRMHGHHVRSFMDGFKMAMTENKNLRDAILQFKAAVEDESIILQSNTDDETAGYYFQELIKPLV